MAQDYFLSRKSCRKFKQEKISKRKVENIIWQASKAPTCGNMQLYSVVVTEDEENKKKLSGFHYNQPASTSAPLILTICADFNRFTKWCLQNKADARYNNFHSFIVAMEDALILAQQITTIAELEGLGTCYLGTVTYNAKEISELLKLPELVVPVASLAIGIPDERGENTKRLPLESLLHYESYHNDSEDKLKEFYKVHDDDPENEKFIKENKKENLAQVFAEVRYPGDLNEAVSESFFKHLQAKGFIK